jgi:hypothetical protein
MSRKRFKMIELTLFIALAVAGRDAPEIATLSYDLTNDPDSIILDYDVTPQSHRDAHRLVRRASRISLLWDKLQSISSPQLSCPRPKAGMTLLKLHCLLKR